MGTAEQPADPPVCPACNHTGREDRTFRIEQGGSAYKRYLYHCRDPDCRIWMWVEEYEVQDRDE